MPKPYPPEFRRDVVAVARKHEARLNQIARDFGISESCLANWVKKADVEEGVKPGVTEKESAELREARKRIRLLEQEAEVMRRAVALAARNAISQRDIDGTILHSDRGAQFRSNAFVRVLKNNGITGPMGRVGACGDNAAMESFIAPLQKNVLDRQQWSTREELRLAIVVWIERTYHRKRRQRRLGKLTPIDFETINMALTAA